MHLLPCTTWSLLGRTHPCHRIKRLTLGKYTSLIFIVTLGIDCRKEWEEPMKLQESSCQMKPQIVSCQSAQKLKAKLVRFAQTQNCFIFFWTLFRWTLQFHQCLPHIDDNREWLWVYWWEWAEAVLQLPAAHAWRCKYHWINQAKGQQHFYWG